MRYVAGFVFMLALVTLPLSAGAQPGEEGAMSEPSAEQPVPSPEAVPEEPAPSSEPAPEEPALELKVGLGGVELVPSTRIALSEDAVQRNVQRHRRGLITSSVFFGLGLGGLVGGLAWMPHAECGDPGTFDFCIPPGPVVVSFFGAAMATGGLIGMAVKGARLAKSRSELRELKEAHYGTTRRIQWDLARSRLVF